MEAKAKAQVRGMGGGVQGEGGWAPRVAVGVSRTARLRMHQR